jgi:hypothetical protein
LRGLDRDHATGGARIRGVQLLTGLLRRLGLIRKLLLEKRQLLLLGLRSEASSVSVVEDFSAVLAGAGLKKNWPVIITSLMLSPSESMWRSRTAVNGLLRPEPSSATLPGSVE